MNDSYSLDATREGLDRSYELHGEAYKNIFTRCDLKFFIVGASSGAMGGTASQEFMIESDSGEDTCAICDACGYAANLEVATSNVGLVQKDGKSESLKEIHTPNVKSIDELKAFLTVDERRLAKSLVYMKDKTPVMILMVGNDQLNEAKLQSAVGAAVRPSHPDELKALTGADGGSIGPIGLKGFQVIADGRLQGANNLISGANKNDYHIINIDLQRDVNVDGYHDLRTVQDGESCPQCNMPLRIVKAIELGHIFKLGTKYADALKAYFLDENGKEQPIIMGSYGIGVDRIVACHIEQHHDSFGISWTQALTPFNVHLILVNSNSEPVAKVAETLYNGLNEAGIEVLYDDRRDVTPGFKFKDADLLGMPLQIIVGEKNVVHGRVELKERRTGSRETIEIEHVISHVGKCIGS